MNGKMTDDEIAIFSALIQWFEYDAILFYNLSKTDCSNEIFERWLAFYNVMRNTSKETRKDLFVFLKQNINEFKEVKVENKDYSIVEKLANECKRKGFTKVKVLSLLSKFACACRPEVFVPIDSINQMGLQKIIKKEGWGGFRNNNYQEFMELVNRYKKYRYEDIMNFYEHYEYSYQILTDDSYYSVDEKENKIPAYKMPKEIFCMRFIDKRLMLEGAEDKISNEIKLYCKRVNKI